MLIGLAEPGKLPQFPSGALVSFLEGLPLKSTNQKRAAFFVSHGY